MNKLLIVDDEHIEREALQFIVHRHCAGIAQIAQASNGREAIRIANEMKPDIVFLDIKMPGISGLDVAESIKLTLPQCRIVFLTAFDYFEYAQRAVKIGVEEFILKPVSNEVVIEVLERIVAELGQERAQRETEKEITLKLNLALKSLEHEFLSALLEGEMEKPQMEEYLSALSVEAMNGFVVSAHIEAYRYPSDASTSMRRQMVKIRCVAKMKHHAEQRQFQCLAYEAKECVYLFLFVSERNRADSEERVVRTCESLVDLLRDEVAVEVSFGISDRFHSTEEVRLCYQQVKWIQRRSLNKGAIIRYREVEAKHLQHRKYPHDKERQLCDKIRQRNETEAFALLEEIIEWLTQSFDSLAILKMKLYELVIVMHRSIPQETAGSGAASVHYYEEIQAADHAAAAGRTAKAILAEILEEASLVRLDLDHDRTGALIEKVCHHIHEHYMDDLTLEEMASLINYSTFYFSRVFKQYRETNFVDYLTGVRIEKSKELLADPLLTIKEVSGRVGFKDSNYFTRVFKRAESVTPTEYRDKKML